MPQVGKRPSGRPKSKSIGCPGYKRPPGRPRKDGSPASATPHIKIKKSRGRPKKNPDAIPKVKRPRGRPRLHPIKPKGPARPRGRPRKCDVVKDILSRRLEQESDNTVSSIQLETGHHEDEDKEMEISISPSTEQVVPVPNSSQCSPTCIIVIE